MPFPLLGPGVCPPLPQTLCDTLLVSLLPGLHSYCYLLLCISLTLVSRFKQVSVFFFFSLFLVFSMISHWMEFTHQSSLVSSNASPAFCAYCPLSALECLRWGLPMNQLAVIATGVIRQVSRAQRALTNASHWIWRIIFPTKIKWASLDSQGRVTQVQNPYWVMGWILILVIKFQYVLCWV